MDVSWLDAQKRPWLIAAALLSVSVGLNLASAATSGAAQSTKKVGATRKSPTTTPTTTPTTRPTTRPEGSEPSRLVLAPETKKAATTTSTVPVELPAAPIGPGLSWSDEFDSLSLATPEHPEGLWRPNNAWQKLDSPGFKDYAGSNWNVNPNHPAMRASSPFSIVDGALRIRAFRTPPSIAEAIRVEQAANPATAHQRVPEWSGGLLILNQEVKTVRYGYIEIRARFPQQGRGMFPAMWLFAKTGDEMSEHFDVPMHKRAAEIDLFESFGVPNRWATTLHRKAHDEVGPTDKLGMRAEDTGRWHTYGLEWKPNVLRVYRDGVKLYDVAPDIANFFDVDMVIRLNFAMDAPWFDVGEMSSASTPELAMDVDYVRVYRAKP